MKGSTACVIGEFVPLSQQMRRYERGWLGLYTVKQVVAMTGLNATRLRAWERRYHVVSPRRTDSRYRMFSEDDVQRLRTMVQLIESGVTTHAAAQIVLSDATLLEPAPPVAAPPEHLAEAAADLDETRLSQLLKDALVLDGFESACDGWLQQAVVELDLRHRAGDLLDVHTRCAEQAIVHRLFTLFEQSRAHAVPWQRNRASSAPTVLSAQQEISVGEMVPLLFTVALSRHGVDARYVGRGISTAGWVRAVRHLRPRAVAISTSSRRGLRDAQELSAVLGEQAPPVQVWLGGPGHDVTDPWVLPMHLRGATHRMLGQLWGGARPGSAGVAGGTEDAAEDD